MATGSLAFSKAGLRGCVGLSYKNSCVKSMVPYERETEQGFNALDCIAISPHTGAPRSHGSRP